MEPDHIRVQTGITWLDDAVPGWIAKIDIDRLDMSDGRHCLLAQMAGEYYTEARCSLELSESEAQSLGFSNNPGTSYDGLTAEWKRRVRERGIAYMTEETPEAKSPVTMDDLLNKHAARLDEMHKNGTVGDHSFLGALYLFAREIKESGVEL